MAGLIKDLWILVETGEVLCDHRHFDISPSLFGAMMSALNTYASLISQGGMMSFELEKETVIHVLKKNHILFVAHCPKKVKEKKMNKALDKIVSIFFNKYPELNSEKFINTWDGEVTKYANFDEEIEDFLINE